MDKSARTSNKAVGLVLSYYFAEEKLSSFEMDVCVCVWNKSLGRHRYSNLLIQFYMILAMVYRN